MGSCEHHYLTMTWAAPVHSKTSSNKPPKRGKLMVCSSQFAWDPAQKEQLLLKWRIECTRICKLRLKNGISSMTAKRPSGMPRAIFFEYKSSRSFCQYRVEPHQLTLSSMHCSLTQVLRLQLYSVSYSTRQLVLYSQILRFMCGTYE